MKQTIAIFCFLLTLSTHTTAQAVMEDEVYIGLSAGIGGQFYLPEFGDGFPFILGTYQNCFKDNFSFNVQGGYGTARSPIYEIVDDEYFIEYQYLLGSIQVRYHCFFLESDYWDAYAGAGIMGYYGRGKLDVSENLADFAATYPDEKGASFTVLAGVRYWVSDGIALYGEFSYGTLYSSLGLALHLR